MTIVEFLRARYDEAESGIRQALATEEYGVSERDLIDVRVKRRIVDRAELVLSAGLNERDPVGPTAGRLLAVPAARQELRLVLRLLAAPYADHPDYDPSWRLAE